MISAPPLLLHRKSHLQRRCLVPLTPCWMGMPRCICQTPSASSSTAHACLQKQGESKTSAEHAIKPRQRLHARVRRCAAGSIGLALQPPSSRHDMPISSCYLLDGTLFRLCKRWQRRYGWCGPTGKRLVSPMGFLPLLTLACMQSTGTLFCVMGERGKRS